MTTPPQSNASFPATKFMPRHFTASPLNQRQSPRRLFREGSIGSNSWKKKDDDQTSPENIKNNRPAKGDDTLQIPVASPLSFLSSFSRRNISFSSPSTLLRPHLQSPRTEDNSPSTTIDTHDSYKNNEYNVSSIEASMKPGAPPISTISVRMPRDLATRLESPKSTQSGSLSLCTISEAKLESTKSPHDACTPKECGSREGPKKPLRLPNEKHEALNQSHCSGVLTLPPQDQTSPRKTAGDSPRIEMDSIGKRTTTEFFQQASIHGHVDSPTLRVVTVQGGYCIDSRNCNSHISVYDEGNSSMVFHQAPEYESLENHRGSGRELISQPRPSHGAVSTENSAQSMDPAQFVATALKRKELQIEELNRELHISKSQLERSSSRLQGMEKDHQELVSAHGELKRQMTERITSIQGQCLNASSSFEVVMQEATKYKADVQTLQDDLKDLNDCRAYLLKKQDELALSFLEIQNLRVEENQTLVSQIEELKTRCELEQSLCIQQSEEAAELRQRCEEYQLSIQKLEMDTQTQVQKIAELTMGLKCKDDSIKELEIALASSKSEIKTLSDSMDAKCESLISEIGVAEDLLHKAQRDLAKRDNELSEARVLISALERRYNELAELSRKSDTATIGVSTGDDPAMDLHSLMTHLQFQLDDTEAKNDDLNKTLRLLELKQASILGEKAKLEERLKELSALSITMKDKNEDQQTQIAEAQRKYDSVLKKLADSENEKARLYDSISESLAMHGTQLRSTIQECAAQFEETRKIEAIESQNQTQKIQHQICALETKLVEKSKELGTFAKEKEKLLAKLYEKSELLAKTENELVLWRAKIQLMETEKDNQQQRTLKDQDENRKYIQDLEGQVRRLQDESKEAPKDLPESFIQTIQQENTSTNSLENAPMLLSEIACVQSRSASIDSFAEFLEWPLELSPAPSSSSSRVIVSEHSNMKNMETKQASKKRKSISPSRDGSPSQTKVTGTSTSKADLLEPIPDVSHGRDDDDSGDFVDSTISSKATRPAKSTGSIKRQTVNPQVAKSSSQDGSSVRGRGKVRGKRGGRGRGRPSTKPLV